MHQYWRRREGGRELLKISGYLTGDDNDFLGESVVRAPAVSRYQCNSTFLLESLSRAVENVNHSKKDYGPILAMEWTELAEWCLNFMNLPSCSII